MELNEYQELAARTINPELTKVEQVQHSLHGLSAEVGELNGLYQKFYQGHAVDPKHRKRYPDGFDAEHSLHRGADDI